MENKQAILTGSNGFLGKNLTRRLLELNFDVTPINSRISEDFNFRELIEGKDYFFHLAWQTDLSKSMEFPLLDFSNDVGGVLRLLEDCKKYNPSIKVIFPSTVTVIGDKNKIPSNEDEKENPVSIYEANKLLAEKYFYVFFKNYGLKSTCLRLSNVFGEYQRIDNPKRGVLNYMIGKALRNEPLTIHGDGKFVRDYSYVSNVIDAFVEAANSNDTNGKSYVLGSGEGRTFNEVVGAIKKNVKEICGINSEIIYTPSTSSHLINKRNFIADSSRFKEDTCWTPKISFEEGLRRTIRFYKEK